MEFQKLCNVSFVAPLNGPICEFVSVSKSAKYVCRATRSPTALNLIAKQDCTRHPPTCPLLDEHLTAPTTFPTTSPVHTAVNTLLSAALPRLPTCLLHPPFPVAFPSLLPCPLDRTNLRP